MRRGFRGREMRLSFSQKLSRLAVRMKDPEWRRYASVLFGGKVLGIAVVMLTITVISGLFFAHVYAADAEVKAADVVNPMNTVWTLLAAFLVFGMQVGFTMLEAGFCRSRETVNVLMECVVDTCLCGLLFYAFGFALCSAMAMASSAITGSSCKGRLTPMRPPGSRSLRFGSFNSRLPTPVPPSPQVR